jgi:hypothetical protein
MAAGGKWGTAGLVDETGIEPATFLVKAGRSRTDSPGEGLSVDLQNYLVDETGIEPATSSLRTMRSPS